MPECNFLYQNGTALPPDLTPQVPLGSIQTASSAPGWQSRLRFFNFDTVKLVVDTDGATINTGGSALFPFARLVASYQFQSPVGIFLFSLAASLTSIAAGNVGIFCAKNNSPSLTLTTGPVPQSIIDVISQPNSLAGIPNPVVRNAQLQLSDSTAMLFNQGDQLSIYACGPNDPTTLITATLTAYYITLGV